MANPVVMLSLVAFIVQLRASASKIMSISCDTLKSVSLGKNTSILSAEEKSYNTIFGGKLGYCLVTVLVDPAIHIWVGLPPKSHYNDRFMALGGGGFAGANSTPEHAVKHGFAGATTDTGHVGNDGSFGMLSPGTPNVQLQRDFAYRSEHLLAVVGKQLIEYFYGKPPKYSYWKGCSTGGRQGNMMAQKYPNDYEGILAGAPAVHFDKLGLAQMWPQVPMLMEVGKPVAKSKQDAATAAAVAACDASDGVADHEIRDPRACQYDATELLCPDGTDQPDCLTPGEAAAINKIWEGPTNANGDRMWYGIPRGASLSALAGEHAMKIPVGQAKYWIYLDPDWDYHALNYSNWQRFFDKTVTMMEPTIGTDYADLRPFRDAGHKLLLWHGWADQMIMPEGTIDYYNQITETISEGNVSKTQEFARLFMAPGVAHCYLDDAPILAALMAWVEEGRTPDSITVHNYFHTMHPKVPLLCPHPNIALHKGDGGFECGPNPARLDEASLDKKANERIFGRPFLPPPPLGVSSLQSTVFI